MGLLFPEYCSFLTPFLPNHDNAVLAISPISGSFSCASIMGTMDNQGLVARGEKSCAQSHVDLEDGMMICRGATVRCSYLAVFCRPAHQFSTGPAPSLVDEYTPKNIRNNLF
jgi:hypothetical protein